MKFRIVSIVIVTAFLMAATGCKSVQVRRTVGLPGLPPVADSSQVKVIKRGKPVPQPYQVVGKVMVLDQSMTWPRTIRRMQDAAASMGADGVIGAYEPGMLVNQNGFGCQYMRTGLAVKWLAPGEARKPVITPFTIKVLPTSDKVHGIYYAPDDKLNVLQYIWLENKGYYVLPLTATNCYIGGLEGARNLTDAELDAGFGPDAQLLLESSISVLTNSSYLTAKAEVKSTLMDKATRKVVFESFASTKNTIIPLVDINFFDPDERKRSYALFNAITFSLNPTALEKLKAIDEEYRKETAGRSYETNQK